MAGHGITCPCLTCCNKFESKGMNWDSDKRRYVKRGGTMRSSAFTTKNNRTDGKTNHYFNGPGDGKRHGHVVEGPKPGEYDYARDVEGNVYIDKRKK